MAVIASVATGDAVEYYTAGSKREYTSYYTGASHDGEPPGRWHGKGLDRFGLEDGQDVDPKLMEDWYTKGKDPRDPSGTKYWGKRPSDPPDYQARLDAALAKEPNALPERVREIELACSRSRGASQSFTDVTFSFSKDVTVQHTAMARAEQEALQRGDAAEAQRYAAVRQRIEGIIDEAVQQGMQHLQQQCGYSRAGRHGDGAAGRWVDADQWTYGSFFQHTSRAGDPQLHVHNVILMSTMCSDGVVRKLDNSLIYENAQQGAAVASRYAQERFADEFGWESAPREDGNGHELTVVDPAVKALFSERSSGINRRTAELVAEYTERYGQEPTALALARLKQQAALATRAPKTHDRTRSEELEDFDDRLRDEVGAGLGRQAAETLPVNERDALVPEEWSEESVIKEAIARAQEAGSTFGRAEVMRALDQVLPSYLGCDDIPELMERLCDKAMDAAVQVSNLPATRTVLDQHVLRNGQSAYVKPGWSRYASEGGIEAEEALRQAAVTRGRIAVDERVVEQWVSDHEHMGLKPDQVAALKGIVSGGCAVDVLVGAAGAGKSYTLGAASSFWADTTGGKLVGLAKSEKATDVLRDEGIEAMNTSQWLAAQDRLARDGEQVSTPGGAARTYRPRPEDKRWSVGEGDIVVIDEASMADTEEVKRIWDVVNRAGAKLVLAGDTGQLSAVSQAGIMRLIEESPGSNVHRLVEPRRFVSKWEGPASMRLRAGDEAAIDEYDRRGRLLDGKNLETANRMAAEQYLAVRAGGESALVICPTNQSAHAVNAKIQDGLVDRGVVGLPDTFLPRSGNSAGRGDLLRCRQNNWDLGVKNQGTYLLLGSSEDGRLLVRDTETGREVSLPKEYVDQHVELGYATTAHGAQGSTVQVGIPIVDETMQREALYPAMTRGRRDNVAIVVTERVVEGYAGDQPKEARTPKAVIADVLSHENEDAKAALTHQREDAERRGSVRTLVSMSEEAVRAFCRERTEEWLDELVDDGALAEVDRVGLAASSSTEQVSRILRAAEQAGLDPHEVLDRVVKRAGFHGSRDTGSVLYKRLSQELAGKLTPDPGVSQLAPAGAPPQLQEHLDELHDLVVDRRVELGARIAEEAPDWAVQALGPVPEEPVQRAGWEHQAGIIGAYREAQGCEDAVQPIPAAPGLAQTELRALWQDAWEAGGHPDVSVEEHQLTDGQLIVRVRAMQQETERLPDSMFEGHQATMLASRELRNEAAELEAELGRGVTDERAVDIRAEVEAKQELADRLQTKAGTLEVLQDERVERLADSLATREAGYRAEQELQVRGVRLDAEDDRMTSEQWLEQERAARIEDDAFRPIFEEDAPAEVYDPELDDLVQVADQVLDVEVPVRAELPELEGTVEAEVVEAEVVPEPAAEVVDEPEPVVTVEPEPAAVPPAEPDVVDAEVVDEVLVEPVYEEDLPPGVPTDAELSAALDHAGVEADRAALRVAMDQAAYEAARIGWDELDVERAQAEQERLADELFR